LSYLVEKVSKIDTIHQKLRSDKGYGVVIDMLIDVDRC